MNDTDLAGLLGEAPRMPDPGFRIDVFALMAHRAQRRAALRRGAKVFAVFTLIGLMFPIAQGLGVTGADAQAMATAGGLLGASYLTAALTLKSRGVLLKAFPSFRG
jgi:hypothetical protein